MVWALGLAATQAAGLREMFRLDGEVLPPWPIGAERLRLRALRTSGLYVRREKPRGPRGFAAVQAASYDLSKITNALGVDFELRDNTTSRFPAAS
jgi:hypothetical protein